MPKAQSEKEKPYKKPKDMIKEEKESFRKERKAKKAMDVEEIEDRRNVTIEAVKDKYKL
jgi:hypothetical protein